MRGEYVSRLTSGLNVDGIIQIVEIIDRAVSSAVAIGEWIGAGGVEVALVGREGSATRFCNNVEVFADNWDHPKWAMSVNCTVSLTPAPF